MLRLTILSIPLYGFGADVTVRPDDLLIYLSIPLYGFLGMSWRTSRSWSAVFQFHCMDSGYRGERVINTIATLIFQFHCMDSARCRASFGVDAGFFQFHCMDSWTTTVLITATITHCSFNSIVWIRVYGVGVVVGPGGVPLSIPLYGFAREIRARLRYDLPPFNSIVWIRRGYPGLGAPPIAPLSIPLYGFC